MIGATERILAVVREVPAGQVVTYGQVARLAGLPGSARQVGYALARLGMESGVPWQRVVRADGSIAPRRAAADQRRRLESEGIGFDAEGRIDLERWRWHPGTDPLSP